jgi:hypothetical protein
MSLSYQKVKAIEVRDPRVIVDNLRDYAVLKGGADVTAKTYTTTNVSQSSIVFSTPPPSPNMILDRKALLTICVRLTLAGTAPANGYLLNVNQDAPRSFPLSSAMDNVSIQINGSQIDVQMSDLIQALTHYNTDVKLKTEDYSMTPTARDQSQNYGDLVGTIRNPLAVFGNSLQGGVTGRGGFNFVVVSNPLNNTANPAAATAVVDCRFTEPLFLLAPFIWGKHEAGGLYNLNSLEWTFNFLTQAGNRFWSHDDSTGASVSSIQWAFGGQIGGPSSPGFNLSPTLNLTWITPPEISMLGPNMSISYPYFRMDRFVADYTNITNGVQQIYTSGNIQFNSIPRRVYLFMRERNSDLFSSPSKTDTYFSIENVNIQFNNRSGILSTASKEQLYQMCVKNHCNLSWEEWSGQALYKGSSNFANTFNSVGSVMCVEFGTDIANQTPIEAPGKSGVYQFQANVTATNISGRTINASLFVVPVYEGVFTIASAGQSVTQIGVLTSNDILDAGKNGYYNYYDVKVNGGEGDFLSGIKDFFSNKVLPLIKQSKIASNLASLVPVVGPALSKSIKNLGYGEGEGEYDGEGEGGVLVGGARLSRRRLRDRLM